VVEGGEVAEGVSDASKQAIEAVGLEEAVGVVAPAVAGAVFIECAVEREVGPAAVEEVADGLADEGRALVCESDDALAAVAGVGRAAHEAEFFERGEHAADGGAADAELYAKVALAHADIGLRASARQGVEQVEA